MNKKKLVPPVLGPGSGGGAALGPQQPLLQGKPLDPQKYGTMNTAINPAASNIAGYY
jgi:hypothetical protein